MFKFRMVAFLMVLLSGASVLAEAPAVLFNFELSPGKRLAALPVLPGKTRAGVLWQLIEKEKNPIKKEELQILFLHLGKQELAKAVPQLLAADQTLSHFEIALIFQAENKTLGAQLDKKINEEHASIDLRKALLDSLDWREFLSEQARRHQLSSLLGRIKFWVADKKAPIALRRQAVMTNIQIVSEDQVLTAEWVMQQLTHLIEIYEAEPDATLLQGVPDAFWKLAASDKAFGGLMASILHQAGQVPIEQRMNNKFLFHMDWLAQMAEYMNGEAREALKSKVDRLSVKVVKLRVLPGDKRFNQLRLQFRTNEILAVSIKNDGVFPHDWRLASQLDGGHVLAQSALIKPGKSGTVFLKLPPMAGKYVFFCSMKKYRHRMSGVLDVLKEK